MTGGILALPVDILLVVVSYIPVESVLCLLQTCRGFHALGSTDYVWHTIGTDSLPLDIPPDLDCRRLSGQTLHRAWVKGLRLERNWSTEAYNPRQLSQIKNSDEYIVIQTQFLSSDWLVTLARAPSISSLCLSIWNVTFPGREYRYAYMEIPHASKFSAATRKGGTEAVVAVVLDAYTRTTNVNVYSVCLDKDQDPFILATFHQAGRIASLSDGTPGELRVRDNIVMISVAHFGDVFSPPTYTFLAFNVDTQTHLTLRAKLPEHFTHVQFRLFPHHLVIAGLKLHERLALQTYDFTAAKAALARPRYLASENDADHDLLGPCLAEDTTDEVPSDSDFSLSDGFIRNGMPAITALVFHATAVSALTRHGTASVFSFPAEVNSHCPAGMGAMPIHVFRTPTSAASDIVCLGRTGYRCVWLERRWDTDIFTLMKASFPSRDSKTAFVERLLPPTFTLPFLASSIQSMSFEESTGRISLGLHTGQLYLLDL
ncbi:hypothetical protein CYLTODRAFT_440599 [Cylindrobasidium torrendii FP15055 ss-10]|uniref:F-box domain-containing protein n=1 Tax=Cylindrobasidium torrendii FP15055 ss-10 TaxID=1314674 RepID=A0A0D7BP60_9AGAR|nr:hypothetical protein CYLTODRAFT_440599 [Cylindrobasidium torrendii FP15055 ss-10]